MSQKTINILLIDDHIVVSEAVALYLSNEADFIVSTVSNLNDAATFLADHMVEIILLDTRLPQKIGIDGVKSVIALGRGAAVIIFSGTADETFVRQTVQVGASGFIPKGLSLKIIPAAIRLVRDGAVFMPFTSRESSTAYGKGKAVEDNSAALSERELHILRFIQAGLTNKEIAREITSSEIKVKMYLRAIFEKLGAKNRSHSVAIAQEMGLIT